MDIRITIRIPSGLALLLELYQDDLEKLTGERPGHSTAVRLLMWEALRKNGIVMRGSGETLEGALK